MNDPPTPNRKILFEQFFRERNAGTLVCIAPRSRTTARRSTERRQRVADEERAAAIRNLTARARHPIGVG